MNLSSNERAAKLVFNLFDTDKSGLIHAHKLQTISEKIGCEFKKNEAKMIIKNCGSKQQKAITFENFLKVMDNHQMKQIEINVDQADAVENDYLSYL